MTTVDADVRKKIDEISVGGSRKPREPAGKQFVWVGRDSLRQRAQRQAQTFRAAAEPAHGVTRPASIW